MLITPLLSFAGGDPCSFRCSRYRLGSAGLLVRLSIGESLKAYACTEEVQRNEDFIEQLAKKVRREHMHNHDE